MLYHVKLYQHDRLNRPQTGRVPVSFSSLYIIKKSMHFCTKRTDFACDILTAAGKGKGRYYVLSNEIHKLLAEDVQYSRNEQAEETALKAQILTLLKKQALSNQDIRQITGKTAQQVRKLMAEMEKDGVILTGKGRGSKYVLNKKI